jgi:murein DD-endopeptidase MepM/ murein hydrolase activator NlpD
MVKPKKKPLFPERQIFLRTKEGTRFVRLSPAVQKVVSATAAIALGSAIWFVIGLIDPLSRTYKAEEIAILQEAYRRVVDAVGTDDETVLATVIADPGGDGPGPLHPETRVGRIAELERRLAASEAERRRLEAEREQMEADRERVASDAPDDKGPRAKPASRNDQEETIEKLIDRARAVIERTSRNIRGLGLEPDRLLAAARRGNRSVGGPFVDFSRAARGAPMHASLSTLGERLERLTALREVVDSIPLGRPVARAQFASGFGLRRDPFNGHLAMHAGLDFSAPAGTPVMTRTAGTVTRAGYSGDYGNLVEIDHGLGIRTRYGHLSRILVRRGQNVNARTTVGLMGSTGRSTGPHLHYEVIYNGRHIDPRKFVDARQKAFEN